MVYRHLPNLVINMLVIEKIKCVKKTVMSINIEMFFPNTLEIEKKMLIIETTLWDENYI